MKSIVTILVGLFFSTATYCQNGEFKVYPNGLIYSEQAMTKLSRTADSLNLKFKTCDFDKVFYSKQQVVGHMIELSSGDIKSAKEDLEQNISFEEFCLKYPQAKITNNILIIRSRYTTYSNRKMVSISHFDLKSDYGFSIKSEDLTLYDKDFQGKWLYEYSEKSQYSKECIKSFFFPESFRSIELPKKYSLMIGYTDCLIDTTMTKFKDDLKEGRIDLPENWIKLSEKKKVALLEEMRSTRVVGFCSMDNGPRIHAQNIALLSAETYNWEIFLKAHLDIMNDRFERLSDGSYAYNNRKTYIKELEELNINITDLLFGISFRVENPASNHYYGSIGRLGRSLSETKNRAEIEQKMLSIIADEELDLYNRLLFYFLFDNYNYYTEDESVRMKNEARLAAVIKTFPSFISERFTEK